MIDVISELRESEVQRLFRRFLDNGVPEYDRLADLYGPEEALVIWSEACRRFDDLSADSGGDE